MHLMRRACSAIFALLLVTGIAGAVPPPAVPKEKLYRETLPNGMQVVILENHRNPVVSLNVVVKVGSMYENEHINGISHFFEHLFFRGTQRRTGEQFKREIEALGGQTNAKTTKDLTHFYINLPSMYAKQGLDILADALENSKLAPAEVNEERKVVIDELRIGKESPAAILQNEIYALAFQKHPYRFPIIGTEKNLEDMTIQDFRDFKQRYYIPKRTVVILVGDVTPSEIMPTVRDYFGPFTGNNNMADDIPQEPKHAEGVREKVVRKDLQNAFVIMGFKAPSVRDRPDIYRVDVMTFLLGQGDGSLLTEQLVEDKKVALNASVDFLTQRDPGLITFDATCPPARVEKVKAGMLDVIKQVREGKFSEADFERAKRLLINSYEFGNETNAGKADGLAFYAAIDNVEFAQSYLDEVRKVTFQDVVAAANKYLDPKNYSVLVVRPPDRRASADEEASQR
jgi:zinc protease